MSRTLLFAAAALAGSPALADEYMLGLITISDPIAYATAPNQPVGGGYLVITNNGEEDDVLLSAEVAPEVAGMAQLHEMAMDGDVMRMSEVEGGIPIPAGEAVVLEQGGLHVMFMQLPARFEEGTRFPAVLTFVTHGRSAMDVDHAWHDFDNARFAELAVGALAARGRRRLLVVAPPADQSYAQHMLAGAERTAAAAAMDCARLADATSDSPGDTISAAIARRLAGGAVDAVLCASVASAVAAVAAIENLGLSVGADVDVAAKEPFPFLRRFRPSIVAVREDVDGAGAFLARAALAAVRTPGAPPMTHLDVPTAASLA